MLFGRIGGDVGYVWIRDFNGNGWGPEIDGILATFDGVRGVVIDIRDNGGGNDPNGTAIASRFADQVRPAMLARFRAGSAHSDFTQPLITFVTPSGTRRFAGPVAVLTNRYVGSAAEDFVMYMRVIPTTFTVGDTTGGTVSNPLWRELPNGSAFGVPQSIESAGRFHSRTARFSANPRRSVRDGRLGTRRRSRPRFGAGPSSGEMI